MSLRNQLMDAIKNKDIEQMSVVFGKMTVDEVNERDENDLSALHVACLWENDQAINLLLATPGIDVNAKDIVGATPVMMAVWVCNEEALKAMLESPLVDLYVKSNGGLGLEKCVGIWGGSEEEKKKCLDMIQEEKLKRLKINESDKESKGSGIEKMKRKNEREDCDNNCGGAAKHIAGDENFSDSKDSTNSVKSTKTKCPITIEEPTVQLVRIVFDATDMGKGRKTMRLNAGTPMREIKKLFPKHLDVDEESFMMCFDNREMKEETPLELFGSNLDGDDNVISIVKAIDKSEVESVDKGASSDKLESSRPEGETDHESASNDQSGQNESYEVRKAKRIKPKCIRASCRNQGQHRCIRCKAVYYCQQDCLSEDWPQHKVYCDYVYKGSKDYDYEASKDYACEENSVPEDLVNKDAEETGDCGYSGGIVEEVEEEENGDPEDFSSKDAEETGDCGYSGGLVEEEEENGVPEDFSNKDAEETGDCGGTLEEVD